MQKQQIGLSRPEGPWKVVFYEANMMERSVYRFTLHLWKSENDLICAFLWQNMYLVYMQYDYEIFLLSLDIQDLIAGPRSYLHIYNTASLLCVLAR